MIRRSGIDNNNNYGSNNNSLAFIIGVAKAEEDIKMKRMIFRASRGTAIASFFDIEEDKNKEHKSKIEKKIFIIFYPSEGKEILRGKLLKICDIFNPRTQTYDINHSCQCRGLPHSHASFPWLY